MTFDEMTFFSAFPEALELYEPLRNKIISRFPDSEIRVQKTQITFKATHGYAFVSHRKMKGCPDNFIILSFGLVSRLDSPRIAVAVEPYPNRWTHHLIISSADDIDAEVMDWLAEAYDFALTK